MKKLLLFILAFSLSFTSFSQEDGDYKWLLGASTGMIYASSDDADAGTITVDALYSVSDDFMLGAVIGLNFGDIDGESLMAQARYNLGTVFVEGVYDLGESDMGAMLGLGYNWDVADNVQFAPTLGYWLDSEVMSLGVGFAIRM